MNITPPRTTTTTGKLSKINLNPKVWGPPYWFFLHTLCFTYPNNPNDAMKKKYYDTLMNFDLFIPHSDIAGVYRYLLNKYPLKPYLDNKEDLVKWGWLVHNSVNDLLEKNILTIEEFYEDYFQQYQTPKDQLWTTVKRNQKFIIFPLFFCLLFFIIYYYRVYQWR